MQRIWSHVPVIQQIWIMIAVELDALNDLLTFNFWLDFHQAGAKCVVLPAVGAPR